MKTKLAFLSIIVLLAACASGPKYSWLHEGGLGDRQLEKDKQICTLIAKQEIPVEKRAGRYIYYGRSGATRQMQERLVQQERQEVMTQCMTEKGWQKVEEEEGV